MAGHGSPPAENKANHPGRKVDRASAMAQAADAFWSGPVPLTKDQSVQKRHDLYGSD